MRQVARAGLASLHHRWHPLDPGKLPPGPLWKQEPSDLSVELRDRAGHVKAGWAGPPSRSPTS